MIAINGLEISYNGSNGWSCQEAGANLTRGCCVNDRFGDGCSIITMSGTILASPGREEIAREIAEFETAKNARVAAITAPVTSTYRARNPSISSAEYDSLRETLGDDLAAQMVSQMQG